MPESPKPVEIELKDLTKIYITSAGSAVGLNDVSLSFRTGEFVAVTGESGSGKTTLLRTLTALDSFSEGILRIDGRDIGMMSAGDISRLRSEYFSFVFQDYNIIESLSVLHNVMLPLIAHGLSLRKSRLKAYEAIRKVGLLRRARLKGIRLSGGEKQRISIAMALAADSPVIACDEPTGNLDSKTAAGIIKLLAELSGNRLIIMATHDYEAVKDVCTRHILLKDGKVVSDEILRDKNNDTAAGRITQPETGRKCRKILSLTGLRLFGTPKKTLLAFLTLLLSSVIVSSGICFCAQLGTSYTTSKTTGTETLEVTNPSFAKLDLSGLVDSDADFVDYGNVLDDAAGSRIYDSGGSELIEGDYTLDGCITDDMVLMQGHKPTAADEAALVFASSEYDSLSSRGLDIEKDVLSSYTLKLPLASSENEMAGIIITGFYVSPSYSADDYISLAASIPLYQAIYDRCLSVRKTSLAANYTDKSYSFSTSLVIGGRKLYQDTTFPTSYTGTVNKNAVYLPKIYEGFNPVLYINGIRFPDDSYSVIYADGIRDTCFSISSQYCDGLLRDNRIFFTVYFHSVDATSAARTELRNQGAIVSAVKTKISTSYNTYWRLLNGWMQTLTKTLAYLGSALIFALMFLLVIRLMKAIFSREAKERLIMMNAGFSLGEIKASGFARIVILALAGGLLGFGLTYAVLRIILNLSRSDAAAYFSFRSGISAFTSAGSLIIYSALILILALLIYLSQAKEIEKLSPERIRPEAELI